MLCLGIFSLLLATAIAQAPQCRPHAGILEQDPASWFAEHEKEFPTEIFRIFQGPLMAYCNNPNIPPQLNPFQKDPEFCLPDKFKGEVCNQCGPSPSQFFQFPFWNEFNSYAKESPNEFGPKPRTQVSHCLRCFALALPHNSTLAQGLTVSQEDIQKDTVTVSTRIACGRQFETNVNGQRAPVFFRPNATYLEELDAALAALDGHPCSLRLPNCDVQDFRIKQAQAAQITQAKKKHIDAFSITQPGYQGQPEAVNSHKDTLMEIPHGKMHLLQARVSVVPGFEGWTNAPGFLLGKLGGGRSPYTLIQESSPGKFGCSVYEYGMVVASPGQVRTACWLTPMFNDPSAKAAWVAKERQKEVELQQSVHDNVISKLKKHGEMGAKFCSQSAGQASNPQAAQFCQAFCQQQANLGPEVRIANEASVCAKFQSTPPPQNRWQG